MPSSTVDRNSFAKLCDCFAGFEVWNGPKTAKVAEHAESPAKRKLHQYQRLGLLRFTVDSFNWV